MKNVLVFILISISSSVRGQEINTYAQAYTQLKEMLEGKTSISFKKAVFTVENAFFDNSLDYKIFEQQIKNLTGLAKGFYNSNSLTNYEFQDSVEYAKNGAIFKIMTDTLFLIEGFPIHYPFSYDFDDFFGEQDWSKQFITKLLNTHSGNCHSMPYLYKILAEELNTKAYLAFAPNHLYIKQRSKNPEIGFYNTELTSKCFPIDAWIMTSGYVSIETIISKIYMDTLGDKQSIAINLVDLAEGYQRKGFVNFDFVLKCCDLALEYYPNYVNGLLLRAETLKAKYMDIMDLYNTDNPSDIMTNNETILLFRKIEEAYAHLIELGYREVPQSIYLKWLEELANNLEKYNNQKINNFKQN